MNAHLLKKQWLMIPHELQERWPELTESDRAYVDGDTERLIEIVQKRRHISAEEAGRDVAYFLDHLKIRHNIA